MTLVETCYSTFERELLAVYLAIKQFHHFLEVRYHQPLTFALKRSLIATHGDNLVTLDTTPTSLHTSRDY